MQKPGLLNTVVVILKKILLLDLAFFLIFGIYHPKITKVCFTIGIIVYMFLKILEKKKITFSLLVEYTPVNKGIFLFLCTAFLSVLFSQDIVHSQEVFFQRYLPYFLFFFIGAYLGKEHENFKFLILLFMLGSIIVSLGGFYDILTVERFRHKVRLSTSFGIDCIFVNYYLYACSFFIGFLLHPSFKTKITSFILFLPVLVCFLFCYSRGSWIALGIAILISFIILVRHKRETSLIIFILLVIFLVVILFVPYFRTRIVSFRTISPVNWGDRVPMWETALRIWRRYPILGAGLGSYEELIYKFHLLHKFKKNIHIHAHNIYLEVLAETGFVGLFSFFYFLALYLFSLVKGFYKRFDSYSIAYIILFFSLIVIELVTSTLLVGVYSASLVWFLLGLGTRCFD